jgi:hypothetical protein
VARWILVRLRCVNRKMTAHRIVCQTPGVLSASPTKRAL